MKEKTTKRRRIWPFIGIAALVVLPLAGFGLWEYHETPEFCANTCHLMEPYEASWRSSDYEAHAHAQEGIVCLECHEPTIEQQVQEVVAYVTGDYKNPLRERKMPQQKCLSCKEHGSYPDLVQTTVDWERNPHNSHWGEMECDICHNQHRPSEVYCTNCHDDVEVPEGWVPATTQ